MSATRLPAAQFRNSSALGISLARLAHDGRITQAVTFENGTGLPEIYNRRIRSNAEIDIVVFVHDDVWIEDPFLVDRVTEGLTRYDVIDLACNKRRLARQPVWRFVNEQWTEDDAQNLSGRVARGEHPFGVFSIYGPVPAKCELLDGVLLADRKSTLVAREVFFDQRFTFDFYDMDLCRTSRSKSLRLGTWPIGVTHQSVGIVGSQSWWNAYRVYLDKWAE